MLFRAPEHRALHLTEMVSSGDAAECGVTGGSAAAKPALVFVGQERSGQARRMESLVAWVKVTQKKRLRVIDVDADLNPGLVRELGVSSIPALVLVKNRRVLGRIEGRATGPQIDDLLRRHLEVGA